jgi:uncharacterized membrane protein YoaK (UPF0700 family)
VVVGIYRRFVKAPAQHGLPAGPAWRTKAGEVMAEATRAAERPMSLPISVLLSFVAGYVDSYTYLGFGLFVAQVTGSFVIAGACVFAAMAMGAQSVLVRLLMTGVPQTNVMTGNMTQLGITTTELILAWRRRRGAPAASAQRQFAKVRARLIVVLLIAVGFLAGVAAGAGAYAAIGFSGAVFTIVVVATLAVWALLLEGRD